MTPVKPNLPWYADWIERCAKTWGVPVVIVGVALAFSWVYGGKFVEAKIKVDASNAATFATVADAVQKLTTMEQEDREFQKTVSAAHERQTEISAQNGKLIQINGEALKNQAAIMTEAREMMRDVPSERKEANRLLAELLQVTRAKEQK